MIRSDIVSEGNLDGDLSFHATMIGAEVEVRPFWIWLGARRRHSVGSGGIVFDAWSRIHDVHDGADFGSRCLDFLPEVGLVNECCEFGFAHRPAVEIGKAEAARVVVVLGPDPITQADISTRMTTIYELLNVAESHHIVVGDLRNTTTATH